MQAGFIIEKVRVMSLIKLYHEVKGSPLVAFNKKLSIGEGEKVLIQEKTREYWNATKSDIKKEQGEA